MNKKYLEQLIKAVETPAEQIPEKNEHKIELESSLADVQLSVDVRLSLLKRYLLTLKEEEEVFFPKFLKYLNRVEKMLFSLGYLNYDFPSVKLFKQLDPKINPGYLAKDVRSHVLHGYFDIKDTVRFGATSHFFNAEMKASSQFKHWKNLSEWKDKFLALGCDKVEVNTVINSDKIHDYTNLYHCLKILKFSDCMMPHVWELYFLSGEIAAIDYAIKEYKLNRDSRTSWQETPLDVATFSGRINAAKHVMEVMSLGPNETPTWPRNLFQTAAWRGSVPVIKYLRYLHQTHLLKVGASSQDGVYTRFIEDEKVRQQVLKELADRSLVQEVELTRLIEDEMREPTEVDELKSLVCKQ